MFMLILYDENGRQISSRSFNFKFDGDRLERSLKTSYEEYAISAKAREMYRDAAHAACKWPGEKVPCSPSF
jgi:hypothetical protein